MASARRSIRASLSVFFRVFQRDHNQCRPTTVRASSCLPSCLPLPPSTCDLFCVSSSLLFPTINVFSVVPDNQCLFRSHNNSVMIPLDTVLTRVVTQRVQAGVVPYKGVVRTLSRIVKEEGLRSMYSSLPLKLMSVVPAIGIQVGGGCCCLLLLFLLLLLVVVVVFPFRPKLFLSFLFCLKRA